jgi:excisionase family DNA binding protein
MMYHLNQLPFLHCSLTTMSTDADPSLVLLTIPDVAKLLKISVSSVRRLQQARKLPFRKVGGSVRFARNDIVSFLERQLVRSLD